MTKSNKRQPSSKRTNMPRDSRKSKSFVKCWEKLSHSGKQDLNILKEAMLLLIANDEPLPPEWKDHQLTQNKTLSSQINQSINQLINRRQHSLY